MDLAKSYREESGRGKLVLANNSLLDYVDLLTPRENKILQVWALYQE